MLLLVDIQLATSPEPDTTLLLTRDAIEHLETHPDVSFRLLCMAFERARVSQERRTIKQTIDFQYIIGQTSKVETNPISLRETTEFAYRRWRRYPSRVVVDVRKAPTSLLTLVANRDKTTERTWILETAYLGSEAPLEPLSSNSIGDCREGDTASLDFWCRHALMYDPTEYITKPFVPSWAQLIERRIGMGPDGFPKTGPFWTGDDT